jgi:hypothetical protein
VRQGLRPEYWLSRPHILRAIARGAFCCLPPLLVREAFRARRNKHDVSAFNVNLFTSPLLGGLESTNSRYGRVVTGEGRRTREVDESIDAEGGLAVSRESTTPVAVSQPPQAALEVVAASTESVLEKILNDFGRTLRMNDAVAHLEEAMIGLLTREKAPTEVELRAILEAPRD